MSNKTYRRGPAITKREAIIAMLSNPGTKIARADWSPGRFRQLRNGDVVSASGMGDDIAYNGFNEPIWHILEENPESPEKAELRRTIEEAEAKIAEVKAKLEALR